MCRSEKSDGCCSGVHETPAALHDDQAAAGVGPVLAAVRALLPWLGFWMIAGALWLAVEPCAAVISGPAMLIRLAAPAITMSRRGWA